MPPIDLLPRLAQPAFFSVQSLSGSVSSTTTPQDYLLRDAVATGWSSRAVFLSWSFLLNNSSFYQIE